MIPQCPLQVRLSLQRGDEVVEGRTVRGDQTADRVPSADSVRFWPPARCRQAD